MFPSQPFTLQTKQNKDKLLFPFLFFLYPLRKGRGQASPGFNLNTLTKINFLLCFIYLFIFFLSLSFLFSLFSSLPQLQPKCHLLLAKQKLPLPSFLCLVVVGQNQKGQKDKKNHEIVESFCTDDSSDSYMVCRGHADKH